MATQGTTPVRGRYAPTPSGELHVGNVWAALLAWRQVRLAGGTFILRVEDIDQPRCTAQFEEQILLDLRWLGLDWDEGPDVGGPWGPYRQSERAQAYDDLLRTLRERRLVYPCYCSRAELRSVASAPHGLESEGPLYPGTCRELSAEDRFAKAQGKRPSLRFRVPERDVTFDDGVMGLQQFGPGFGGDFVVLRADGIPSYQLAVVVDDVQMGITHVLRGRDLLDSTPRQLWLYESMRAASPHFSHVPLVTDSRGQRLSKRDKSLTIAALRDRGVAAEWIIGSLAHAAGWLPAPEPLGAREFLNAFRDVDIPSADLHLPSIFPTA